MMMIGSINSYTKTLKLQTQFQMKQSRGELQSHKTLEQYLGETESVREGSPRGDDQLRSIHTKLMAGGKLTAEERRYLQAKDPEAYAKLRQNEQEQKAFEQKLRQCKTKEEAQRLKMSYLNASLITVRAVENNSSIPLQKKLEIVMQEKQRCDKIEESSRKFAQSGEYGKLPTQVEEAKAEKDRQEAEEASRTPSPELEAPHKEESSREKTLEEKHQKEKPAIHVESREEKKVRRARTKARRNSGPDFAQAVAAYQSAGTLGADPTAGAAGVDVTA